MIRNLTLVSAVALMTIAGCSNEIDDANLEDKAAQVAEQVAETTATAEATVETAMADALIGPTLGEIFPVASLAGADGTALTLADLTAERGGVVVLSRSAEWCPYCQRQMIDLKDAQAELESMGMKLSVLTYDTPEILAGFAAENDVGYQFISDTGSETIKALNLLNTDVAEGSRVYGVPHPAVIVLAADGEMRNSHIGTDYKVRPSNAEVIALAADVDGG